MNRGLAVIATGTLALVISAAPLMAQGGPGGGNGPGNGAGQGKGGPGQGNGPGNGAGQGRPKSDNNGHGHNKDMIAGGPALMAANAVRAASISSAQLQVMRSFTPPTVSSATASAPSAAVATIVAGGPGVDVSAAALQSALAPSGVASPTISSLVQSIEKLGTVPVKDGGRTAEARIRQAASNFNAFVNSATPEFLANPPAEFHAVRRALTPLVLALDPRTATVASTSVK